jgi:glutamate N-acetyltransferase/amino-acid N-acetyltransferase
MNTASLFLVPGFRANGIHAGIKADGRPDLALLYSETPAVAAGVFTINAFQAAPVLLDLERIGKGVCQAVIVNSGFANAATGAEGMTDARAVSRSVSQHLGIDDDLVLVASTGVIGHRFPLEKIQEAMPVLVAGLRPEGIEAAEAGIMTTDRYPKMARRQGVFGGKRITLCGIAKGAGMIQPNMATMLAFVMTDAAIARDALEKVFRNGVQTTFNSVTVDGCMSTNDTALILANGTAENPILRQGDRQLARFGRLLGEVLMDLARGLVRDGEGATKLIEVTVSEAKSRADARKIAYAIANSNLVKTAFFGGDPNWGRIISAAGSVGVPLPPEKVRLAFEGITLFAGGTGVTGQEEALAAVMAQPEIRVNLSLGMGKSRWTVCTSDLTFDYVKINAHYHT